MDIFLLLTMIVMPLISILLTVVLFILYFSREKPVREGQKILISLIITAVAVLNALPLAMNLFGLWIAAIAATVLFALFIPIIILIYR